MEKPPPSEAEHVNALMVLKTVLTLPGMHGRPGNSVTDRVHMAIFRHGYKFQSRVLCIPDRYGLLWPAPPGVQEDQGGWFALLIFICVTTTISCVSLGLLLVYDRPSFTAMMVGLAGGSNCLFFLIAWVRSLYDDRRYTGASGHVV